MSRNQNYCLADNSQKYNGGDFGGYLTPGQTYYVAVTYVFSDGEKVTTAAQQLMYNGPGKTEETTVAPVLFSPVLTGSSEPGGFVLNWDISPSDRSLDYYKVVISQSTSTPVYPANGWLHAITNRSATGCTVDNSTAYSSGDFGSYLTPGTQYAIAITYCFSSGDKVTSNVLKMTYEGPAAP